MDGRIEEGKVAADGVVEDGKTGRQTDGKMGGRERGGLDSRGKPR